MKILNNPLGTWAMWVIVLLGIFVVFMKSFFLKGLETDESGISLVIILFFVIGLVTSFLDAKKLTIDEQHLNLLETEGVDSISSLQGRIPSLIKRIQAAHSKNHTVEVGTVIDSFDTYHGSSIRTLSVISTILVTFGLIGTMIGLISSIAGLNELVNSIGASQSDLMRGMQSTINGMGVAFYTTFFGAFFGGVTLRMLSSSLLSSLSKISAGLQNYIALELYPVTLPDHVALLKTEVQQLAASWKEMSATIKASTNSVNENLSVFNLSLKSADLSVQQFTQRILQGNLEVTESNLEKKKERQAKKEPEGESP
jgi:uncharacterized small protein (DUF1192 family)